MDGETVVPVLRIRRALPLPGSSVAEGRAGCFQTTIGRAREKASVGENMLLRAEMAKCDGVGSSYYCTRLGKRQLRIAPDANAVQRCHTSCQPSALIPINQALHSIT